MNPTSHLPELDLLRRQVADLARELGERDRVLHEQTRHFHVAQALAHLGTWNWDIASGKEEWSDELYRIFGYEPQSREMTFDSFVSTVLPDDHDRVLASIDDALAGTTSYDMEFRIVRPDGEVRTVHSCGEVARDGSGQPLRMSGTALDITDRKQTELALQQREAHFRALIEHSSDIITVLNLDGTIQFESPSFERLLGYAQHELNGRSAFEFVHHEDLPAVTEKFRLLIERPGMPQTAEFRFRHKDGSWRHFEGIGRVIRDPDGRCSVIVNSRDITQRKGAEAMLQSSQEKLRQALHASGTGLWDWNTETNEAALSQEWKRQLGYEPAELADSFETWTAHLHPDDRERAVAYARDYMSSREGDYRQEFRLKHKDGGYRWIEARASFVTEADGRQVRLLGSHTDITDRKQMEEAVRESEERYRTLVELSPSGVFVFSNGRAAYVNHRAVVLLGARDPREILGRPIVELIHADYHQEVRDKVKRMLSGGASVHSAERMYLKMDGTPFPVQVEAGRIMWNGKPAILSIFSDITERTRSEKALCESEERFSKAFRTSPHPIGITEVATGRCIEVNDACLDLFGFRREEVIGNTTLMLGIWPNLEDRVRVIERLKAGHPVRNMEFCLKIKSGALRYLLTSADLAELNGTLCVVTVANDITDRKQAEEALRASEERFAKAFQASLHSIVITELDSGRVVDANDAACQKYGFRKGEVDGQTTLQMGLWHSAEERARFVERLKSSGSVRDMEVTLRTRDGEMRQILLSSELIELNGKQCGVTVGDDITDRKQAEEALRASEERFAKAFKASPHPVVISELDSGQVVDANDAACRMFGYHNEEVVGQTTAQIGLWHSMEERDQYLELLKREGSVRNVEVKLRSGNGEVRQCMLSSELIMLNGKQCAVTVGDDITERKRMERALRRTQFSVDHAVEAILWVDQTGQIFNVNETACRMLGYTRQDLTTMTLHDIDPNFPVERWPEHWSYVKKQGALAFEAKFWSRTGCILETDVTVNYLQYEGKEYGCMILRDVGERKRAEADLRRSHTFLRQVIDTDPDFIFAKDRDGRFTMANKAVADWYGTTVEELIGKSDADFNADADEVGFFRWSDLEVIHSGRDLFIPEEKITDAGRTRWLQTIKRPICDDQGQVQMVLGAATDITERKRMEEILLQRERDLSAALQERERISQDLHDGILQSLYAVGLGLEVCKPLIRQQQDPVAEKFMATLDQAIGQLNHIMTEVRNFIAGLESHVMQGGDFSTALRTMVEAMSISASAKCRVRIDDAAAGRLSTEQALHIINIVREGVSNALRHSHAKQITVSLRDLIHSDRLAVTDDGIGFSTGSVQGIGHGLVNMAARAQKVRGLFAIQSKPDKGTRISLDLPKDTHYAHT